MTRPRDSARVAGLWTDAHAGADVQTPMDAAVVIVTVLRPSIVDALRSVFAQDFPGRIHVLIGIDVAEDATTVIAHACKDRPANCVVQVLDPGFSTSVRHGGLHPARDGGVLRCVLTSLANSRYVAYLDDDNWWGPTHLATLRAGMAAQGADWGYSMRWFVHPVSRRPVCVDLWESVGPGRGLYAEIFGGAVDTNCLMLDKLACDHVVRWWNVPVQGDPGGMSADRNVFYHLARHGRGAATGKATAFYVLDVKDSMHETRMKLFGHSYNLQEDPLQFLQSK